MRSGVAVNMLLLMMLAKAAVADGAAGTRPEPIGNPGTWVTTLDYPMIALQHEMEGVVSITMRVSAEGKVVGCVVTQSSGYEVLDGTTCTLMKLRAEYSPARDKLGKAVPSDVSQRIRWQQPQDADSASHPMTLPAPNPHSIIVQYDVDASGVVVDCEVPWSVGLPPGMDPCAAPAAIKMPPFRNVAGHLVPKRVIIRNSVSVEDIPPSAAKP